jgi:hypothetical protein
MDVFCTAGVCAGQGGRARGRSPIGGRDGPVTVGTLNKIQLTTEYLRPTGCWGRTRSSIRSGGHVERRGSDKSGGTFFVTRMPHLAMRGAPLKAIQELLGHATIEMTMRYAHLSPGARRDSARLLDALPIQENGYDDRASTEVGI